MKVHVFEPEDWVKLAKNGVSKQQITEVVEQALKDVSKILPRLSSSTNVVIGFNSAGIIKETGNSGRARHSQFIEVKLSTNMSRGINTYIKDMQTTVLHEANHAARWNCIQNRYLDSGPSPKESRHHHCGANKPTVDICRKN